MNPWMIACIALLPPIGVCMAICLRGDAGVRLVGLQVLAAVVTLMLVALTFATDQPALIDLGLALSVLGLPGAILFATFLERAL